MKNGTGMVASMAQAQIPLFHKWTVPIVLDERRQAGANGFEGFPSREKVGAAAIVRKAIPAP